MNGVEFRGDPPVAYLTSVGLPVWVVVRMLRECGSAVELARTSQICESDISVALAYFELHGDEVERAIADEQAWAREVQGRLESQGAVPPAAPGSSVTGAARYRVCVRNADGTEVEIGTQFSPAPYQVGDVIDLPDMTDQESVGAPVRKFRVVAIEAHDDLWFAGTIVVEQAL